MERLTFDGNFCDIAQCRELPCPYNGACSQRKVWERLKAYEDTGMTPAEVHSMQSEWCAMMAVLNSVGGDYTRLRELAEADKDGRVVVLPCKGLSTKLEDGRQMILEQAIAHLESLLKYHDFECEACKQDHRDLLELLVELKERRVDNG